MEIIFIKAWPLTEYDYYRLLTSIEMAIMTTLDKNGDIRGEIKKNNIETAA